VMTELLITFPDTQAEQASNGKEIGGKYGTAGKGLKAITLIPCNAPETGGRFRVWLYKGEELQQENGKAENKEGVYEDGQVVLLWDRKIEGGFPELKDLVSISPHMKRLKHLITLLT
jgi:predicted Rdx family selenoprotein